MAAPPSREIKSRRSMPDMGRPQPVRRMPGLRTADQLPLPLFCQKLSAGLTSKEPGGASIIVQQEPDPAAAAAAVLPSRLAA
jgi:hypothetical protein